MGKMKELSMILDEMIESGNNMAAAATALKKYFSEASADTASQVQKPEPPVQDTEPAVQKKDVSLKKEDVRKLLADKANANGGAHRAEVKALVKKYSGSGYLSDIKPEQYEALVAELGEVTGDA